MELTRGSRPEAELRREHADALRRWDEYASAEPRWSQLAFENRGVRVRVTTDVPELLEHLPACLPPDSSITDATAADRFFAIKADAGGYCLTADVTDVTWAADAETALAHLGSMLDTAVATASLAGVFVHAGVVGWRGRAVVLPGRSGTGKTTLVLALVAAGADYYSDEFAVIADDGRVHAYPRPPGVRHDGPASAWARRNVTHAGASDDLHPFPLGLVAITRYRVATIYRPQATTPAEGVVALMKNTVRVRARPEQTLAALTRAVEGASVVSGKRGDADRAAASILQIVDASADIDEGGSYEAASSG